MCVSALHGSQLKELLVAKAGKNKQQNKLAMDYNQEYKINIHESILI